MVRRQDRAEPREAVEQVAHDRFLVRPRVGEHHVEVADFQIEVVVGVIALGGQPRVGAAGVNAVLRPARHETPLHELHRQVEVRGQLARFLHQTPFDLDPAGVEVEHRRQPDDHAEPTAPLAEPPAARERALGDGPQHRERRGVVARHERGHAALRLEPVDALLGFAEEPCRFGGQFSGRHVKSEIAQWHQVCRVEKNGTNEFARVSRGVRCDS